MTLKCLILFLILDLVSCYTYPLFGGKRYLRTVPIRRSYISIPMSHLYNEYQLPEYDDAYLSSSQNDYEYNAYDKYPFVQYFGYYPNRNYYYDKNSRRNLDGYEYIDDQIPQEDGSDEIINEDKGNIYPYGQETWYEEDVPRFDRNAEANQAFLQNLIMAQMYQDARNKYPYGSPPVSDDYDDQHWFYGVPTTEVEDKEKVKEYFKNKEDEEVKELESLARKKGKSKKLKEKEAFKKQKTVPPVEKPTKPKSKMTDDEYFDMQKQIIVNSRKNSYVPAVDDLRLNKKQIYDSKNNFWDLYKPLKLNPESPLNSAKKINLIKDKKNYKAFSDSKVNAESSTASVSLAAATKRPSTVGQKEVVLPRPSNPVRRLYGDISNRSLHQPSVYDTIKKLLNMEKDLQAVSF